MTMRAVDAWRPSFELATISQCRPRMFISRMGAAAIHSEGRPVPTFPEPRLPVVGAICVLRLYTPSLVKCASLFSSVLVVSSTKTAF